MRKQVEESAAAGHGCGGRFSAGRKRETVSVCCAGRISSRCLGNRGSRRRWPRTGTTGLHGKVLLSLIRRDVRVVEGARLESVCRGDPPTVGSNPTLSAILYLSLNHYNPQYTK